MKKIEEMKNKLSQLKTEAQNLLDENKVKDAQAKMEEIKNLKDAIAVQEELDKEQQNDMKAKGAEAGKDGNPENTKKNATAIRAMLKKVTGQSLTQAENDLLLPTVATPEGDNGEGYILPEDIQTKIHEKMREYRSLREVLGYVPAGALTGAFPVENFETLSELVDFTDGEDGESDSNIKFNQVRFNLKEKAGFIKLSNTLLAMTDNDLIEYVARIFAKKATVTENKMALEVMRADKEVKTLTSWQDLQSSINVDLDPAALSGTVIVTNQDGFDFLDRQLDKTGRPILQHNPTNPTEMRFKGYPIFKFSNANLPTVEGMAPIFYGNLAEGVKIVDWKGQVMFRASTEAGFWSNTTVARMIEFVDVVQCDSSDKCYVYGEIDTTAVTEEEETV